MTRLDDQVAACTDLLHLLRARDYRFVTPTPASHKQVVKRADRREARGLRDVFGWSLPFGRDLLDAELWTLMNRAGVLAHVQDGYRSTVRVSSLGEALFMHSAYPTEAEDSVFFGPDSYRFADFVLSELSAGDDAGVLVDIGAGAGVGAIIAAERRPAARLVLTDVNAKALRFARINAAFAGRQVETIVTDGVNGVDRPIDLALANPPYIIDPSGRAYRDGGGMHGGQLSLDLARATAQRLASGGRLLLYTGAAILEGNNPLGDALADLAARSDCAFRMRELDPDVFGEELALPHYADVERISVIGAVIERR